MTSLNLGNFNHQHSSAELLLTGCRKGNIAQRLHKLGNFSLVLAPPNLGLYTDCGWGLTHISVSCEQC